MLSSATLSKARVGRAETSNSAGLQCSAAFPRRFQATSECVWRPSSTINQHPAAAENLTGHNALHRPAFSSTASTLLEYLHLLQPEHIALFLHRCLGRNRRPTETSTWTRTAAERVLYHEALRDIYRTELCMQAYTPVLPITHLLKT